MEMSVQPVVLGEGLELGRAGPCRCLSSDTISHSTPAGYMPAALTRSMVASVCPARFNTPPAR